MLPLVVRAGAGSVRDSMSVMDQLLAGASTDGVTYAMATSLLGYTDASLLDSVVEAFATGDGAAAFEVVDRIIDGGNDPRRFVADLLERLRDLVILAAVPDALEKGLIDAPTDVLERMQAQAGTFGAAELSRAADLVNTGLTEMRGATSPRLQLELICARVMLPAAYGDEQSVMARLDRLERGVNFSGGAPAPTMGYVPGPDAHVQAQPPAQAQTHAPVPRAAEPPPRARPYEARAHPARPRPRCRRSNPRTRRLHPTGPAHPGTPTAPTAAAPGATRRPRPRRLAHRHGRRQRQTPRRLAHGGPGRRRPTSGPGAQRPRARLRTGPRSPDPGGSAPGRRPRPRTLWPNILEVVKNRRRFTWILLSQNAQVTGFDGTTLQIGFVNAGARDNFNSSGSEDVLKQALAEQFNVQWKIEAVVDPSGGGTPPPQQGGPYGGAGGGTTGGYGGAPTGGYGPRPPPHRPPPDLPQPTPTPNPPRPRRRPSQPPTPSPAPARSPPRTTPRRTTTPTSTNQPSPAMN